MRHVVNSRQEAEQAERKEVADKIKEMSPEQRQGFVNWMNKLILDPEYMGEDESPEASE